MLSEFVWDRRVEFPPYNVAPVRKEGQRLLWFWTFGDVGFEEETSLVFPDPVGIQYRNSRTQFLVEAWNSELEGGIVTSAA